MDYLNFKIGLGYSRSWLPVADSAVKACSNEVLPSTMDAEMMGSHSPSLRGHLRRKLVI